MGRYLALEEIERRKSEIIRLAKSGMPRRQISRHLKTVDTFVKQVLDEANIPVQRKMPSGGGEREHLWTKTGDNLRHAITTRAAKAAREQLKKLSVLGDG